MLKLVKRYPVLSKILVAAALAAGAYYGLPPALVEPLLCATGIC